MATPTEEARAILARIESSLQLRPPQRGEGAPLSSYAVRAIAAVTGQGVYVLEILRNEQPGGKLETRPKRNPLTASVLSSVTKLLGNDPNRVFWMIVNLGSSAVLIDFDNDPTTTSGLQVSPNGGVVTCEGNELRVYGPATARSSYYDRNPVKRVLTANDDAGAANLADGAGWTYTVPAATKAYWEAAMVQVRLRNLVACDDQSRAYIAVTPSGGVATNLLVACTFKGEAGTRDTVALGAIGLLAAGDSVSGRRFTNNAAVGSNVELLTSSMFTEFDA